MEPTTHADDTDTARRFGGGDRPNHYRTLGLVLFESDPAVIDAAASRRMAEIRSAAQAHNERPTDDLLKDVATARSCLLDPRKKEAYDAALIAKVKRGRRWAARLQTLTEVWGHAVCVPIFFVGGLARGGPLGIAVLCLLAAWPLLIVAAGIAGWQPGLLSVGVLGVAALSAFAFGLYSSRVPERPPAGVEPAGLTMDAGLRGMFWMGVSLVCALSAAIWVVVCYADVDWVVRLTGLGPVALWLLAILTLSARASES